MVKNSNDRDGKSGKRRGPKPSHPWALWFDRPRTLTLRRGKDFTAKAYAFAIMMRNEARKRGIKVSITVSDDQRSVTATVHNDKVVWP